MEHQLLGGDLPPPLTVVHFWRIMEEVSVLGDPLLLRIVYLRGIMDPASVSGAKGASHAVPSLGMPAAYGAAQVA